MSVNSGECHSRAYTMAMGGLGPHILMCKCSLVSAPLNQCPIKSSKHLGFPSRLLIFALLLLLFGHLRCNHNPRTESHRTSGMQLILLLPPRTSVTCLRPCDQVGKRSNQMSCFSVLTESQSTTLHCTGEVSAGFSGKKKNWVCELNLTWSPPGLGVVCLAFAGKDESMNFAPSETEKLILSQIWEQFMFYFPTEFSLVLQKLFLLSSHPKAEVQSWWLF